MGQQLWNQSFVAVEVFGFGVGQPIGVVQIDVVKTRGSTAHGAFHHVQIMFFKFVDQHGGPRDRVAVGAVVGHSMGEGIAKEHDFVGCGGFFFVGIVGIVVAALGRDHAPRRSASVGFGTFTFGAGRTGGGGGRTGGSWRRTLSVTSGLGHIEDYNLFYIILNFQ